MTERCVCCGEIIPEGQQTCPSCKKGVGKMANEVRLIDANALSIQVMDASYWDNQDEDVIWNLVQDAPTVDAEPVVHGRWQLVEYQSSPFGVDQEYQCSICGTPVDDENYRTRYCPNCGAKMDGDGNG